MLAHAVERRRAPSETRTSGSCPHGRAAHGPVPDVPGSHPVRRLEIQEACTLLAVLDVLTTTVVDNDRGTMPNELPLLPMRRHPVMPSSLRRRRSGHAVPPGPAAGGS